MIFVSLLAADDVVAALYRKTTEKPGATTTPAPVATVQVVTTHGGYKGGLHGGLLGAVGKRKKFKNVNFPAIFFKNDAWSFLLKK